VFQDETVKRRLNAAAVARWRRCSLGAGRSGANTEYAKPRRGRKSLHELDF
jgi:hypothetical protein